MISNNDMSKAITAEDVLRRIGAQFNQYTMNINELKDSLKKNDNIIKKFTDNILKYTESQADGNITAWFFNGIPTLDNEPYISFDKEYMESRAGDFYYDRNTGTVYILSKQNDEYVWEELNDKDLSESLAIANSESDTADNKRNMFIDIPFTPYDVGDIWYDNGIIKRCRCSRSEGEIQLSDWCLQSDYSDTFVLLETTAILNQFQETVGKDYVSHNQLEATRDSILGVVESETTKLETKFNDYETVENVTEVKNRVEDLQTSTERTFLIVEDIQVNGVSKVRTEKGFTFNDNGMTIDEINSPTKSVTDTNGLTVIDKTGHENETLLFAGYDENLKESLVKTKNISVEKYFNIGKYSRIEDYEPDGEKPGTGIFFVG